MSTDRHPREQTRELARAQQFGPQRCVVAAHDRRRGARRLGGGGGYESAASGCQRDREEAGSPVWLLTQTEWGNRERYNNCWTRPHISAEPVHSEARKSNVPLVWTKLCAQLLPFVLSFFPSSISTRLVLLLC